MKFEDKTLIASSTIAKIREKALEYVADGIDGFEASAAAEGHNIGQTPIERALLIALFAAIYYEPHRLGHHLRPAGLPSVGYGVVFDVQKFIGDWPVDFVFYRSGTEGPRGMLVVECDGHAYHERTKEQAKRDRSRDRLLQEQGYTVFRFTGSEIVTDPCACASQIMVWLLNQPKEPRW